VDDIVICSRNHEEHVIHVRQVLQALQDNGLVIHAEKCVWGVQELEYLGHKISAAGVLPLPSHVAPSSPSSQQHTWHIPQWGRSCRWLWTPQRRT
jgi:hypothetical protein